MSDLIIQVTGRVIVAVLIAWIGIGRKVKIVHSQGVQAKKTGKWMIVISVIMIMLGIILFDSASFEKGINFNNPKELYSISLLTFGIILLIIGKIVAWFQRL